MRPSMRQLWLLSVAVLAVLALAGCQLPGSIPSGWTWVTTMPDPSARVAVVGDSLTWQAEHGSSSTTDPYYLRHHLIDQLNAQGWAGRVAAKSGATTDALRMWAGWASPPDVIVMALGTNDNYYNVPMATSVANIRGYLGRWPSACVVYVGVVPSVPRGIDDTAPTWNDWLRAEAAATGSVYVDWPAYSATHPTWFTSDLLHHTAAGQTAYRQAILEGIKQCL